MIMEFNVSKFRELSLDSMERSIRFAKTKLKEIIEEFQSTEPLLKEAIDEQSRIRNERAKPYVEQINDIEKERKLIEKEGKLTKELDNEYYSDMIDQLESMLKPINDTFECQQRNYDDSINAYNSEILYLKNSIQIMEKIYLEKNNSKEPQTSNNHKNKKPVKEVIKSTSREFNIEDNELSNLIEQINTSISLYGHKEKPYKGVKAEIARKIKDFFEKKPSLLSRKKEFVYMIFPCVHKEVFDKNWTAKKLYYNVIK